LIARADVTGLNFDGRGERMAKGFCIPVLIFSRISCGKTVLLASFVAKALKMSQT